jgi:hypothetical protein
MPVKDGGERYSGKGERKVYSRPERELEDVRHMHGAGDQFMIE